VPDANRAVRAGVIGLGVMGSAIAGRLLARLGSLVVHDVRPDAAAALVAAGATVADSAAALAAVCDVVVLSLNTADVVEAAVFAECGLAAGAVGVEGAGEGGARGHLLVVDMSSIDPASTRRLAERAADCGIAWVDAPLSGGAPGARDGRLTVMVGGDDADVARARGVLDHLASRVTHLGPVGTGQLVKLVNQVLVGISFGAIAEAAALVRSAGLPAEPVLAALTGGRADSSLLQEFFGKFVAGDLTPTGRVANMVKDLETARDHARVAGVPLPVTSLVSELNRWLLAQGLGDADNAALMGYYDARLLPGGVADVAPGGVR
jgi:2-hydroxy-3-oxopropionate reductase